MRTINKGGFVGGSENRSGSFSFYTKFDDFLCAILEQKLAISDVNSAGRPPSYWFPHLPSDTPTTPLPFSDHKAPCSLSLSFIPLEQNKSGPVLSQKKTQK